MLHVLKSAPAVKQGAGCGTYSNQPQTAPHHGNDNGEASSLSEFFHIQGIEHG